MHDKPTIAVDIDEVLMPHFVDLIAWYNKKYGTSLTLEDNHPTEPDNWGTDDIKVAVKRVHGFFDTPEFMNSKPFKEATKATRFLSKNYKLVVVTARDDFLEEVTKSWLDEHFTELFHEAHFSQRFNLEGKRQSKGELCLSAGAEYLIDDALDNCEDAVRVGIQALLFGDYPWNQGETSKGVTRVKDWQEVLEYFENESAG